MSRAVISLSISIAAIAACGKSSSTSNPPAKSQEATPSAAAAHAEPLAGVDPALQTVIASSPTRTDAERARDGARHPAETLTFFGLKPDSHVVELWPGGGWYTAILAPYLRDKGQLTVTMFDPAGDPEKEDTKDAIALTKRFGTSPDFAKVQHQQIAPPAFNFGPDGSADLVVTFRNVHNWIPAHTAADIFKSIARVLKKGGVLGVTDHRATKDQTDKQVDDTGYVSEAQVIALAKDAGLVLDGRSEINANPRDTKDHPHGVWSLPPTYQGKDVDHDKFAAIGESDRMTLRFKKP
jgi:predicted methyltransferase